MALADRTTAGDRLHDTADRIVTTLTVGDHGESRVPEEEMDAALDDGREELLRYRSRAASERNEAGDVLAEALSVLFEWPRTPKDERADFTVVLYALEMARYQYGGRSAYDRLKPTE
jgi:hypothetical protein